MLHTNDGRDAPTTVDVDSVVAWSADVRSTQ